jgi:hypothetical protein
MKMATFPDEVVEVFRKAKIMGVRAGTEHKYTGVWVVVVDGRVFARSWNNNPTGWFQSFRKLAQGTVQVEKLELSVKGRIIRSAQVRDAVTAAFAQKYPTKGSRKWVEGFAQPERVPNTLEFVPD